MGEPQVHHPQCGREAMTVFAGTPRGKCAGPHLGEWDRRTLCLGTFAWRRLGNRTATIKQSGGLQRFGDVGAAIPAQCLGYGPVVFALCPRQAALGFHETGDLLSARVIVPQVDSTTVRPNQTPDHVPMGAPVLFVAHAAPRRVFKSKLPFVVPHEGLHHRFRIGATRRRIDVNVMHWAICAAVSSRGYQFPELPGEIGSGKATRLYHDYTLPTLPRQKMTRQRRAALAPSCAGNHGLSS